MENSNSVVYELTNEEMKKKKTGIAVKELQVKCDFGGRIGQLFIFFPSERCIHKDCIERIVVNKDNKTVLLLIVC